MTMPGTPSHSGWKAHAQAGLARSFLSWVGVGPGLHGLPGWATGEPAGREENYYHVSEEYSRNCILDRR